MAKTTFKFGVSSRKRLYESFLELYPDMAKHCWGYEGWNWDKKRRSILIRMTEDPLEIGTQILFEVSRDKEGNWTVFRTLLIPYLVTDSEGKLCTG